MADLSISLDDLIKKNGSGKGRGKGKGRGEGRGRGAGRGATKAAPKPTSVIQKPKGNLASAMSTKTQPMKTVGGLTTGTKLKISNLDHSVTSEDLSELFSDIGEIKSAEVVPGKGLAFVVYKKKADALEAVNQYNGVPLDGRPLRIGVVGGAVAAGASAIQISAGGRGGRKVVITDSTAAKPTAGGRGGRGGRGAAPARGKGAGKGKGKGREPKESATMEDLDADLEAYTAQGS